jgi:hypothetical protein
MNDFAEGVVVICNDTGQAGTIVEDEGRDVWVLLRNSNIWTGSKSMIRLPQNQEDLDACPIDVERVEPKVKRREE